VRAKFAGREVYEVWRTGRVRMCLAPDGGTMLWVEWGAW
jgi:hypothetical protein